MRLYAIYDHPSDYPEGFIVRVWEIYPASIKMGPEVGRALSLDSARALIPEGLASLPRQPSDDPCIVETWF